MRSTATQESAARFRARVIADVRRLMDKNRWLIDLAESPQARFWKMPYSDLSHPEQIFVVIWELEAEVNNGGFEQYYFNSAGDKALVAPAALREIGANDMARIVEEANAVFGPDGPPTDRKARQRALETLNADAEEHWARLDELFFKYPDNLTSCLYNYIQTYKAQIAGLWN